MKEKVIFTELQKNHFLGAGERFMQLLYLFVHRHDYEDI
jgi:hypothetical protein